MSNPIKDIYYSEDVNHSFSEAVYQKMATKRFGLAFCCETDLDAASIDKELLDLNNIMDAGYTPVSVT